MEKVARRAKNIEESLRWRAKGVEASQRKRLAKRAAVKAHSEAWERKQQAQRGARDLVASMRAARERRQQAWQQGVLAPRHDVGIHAGELFGALDSSSVGPPDRHPRNRLEWWHIAEGDRVVLLSGRDRGRIAEVEDVAKESATVRVKGLEMQRFRVPDFLRSEIAAEEGADINTVAEIGERERSIPVEQVRLVAPLPLPGQDSVQDVVIERVQRLPAKKRGERDQRCVAGNPQLVIPWPETVEPEESAKKDDTPEGSVAIKTFRPYLVYPPLPLSVLDELRHKHSRFRTRLTDSERVLKEKQDARAERREGLYKTMQTPLQQMAELRARQRELTKKELTPAQLAVIGKAMSQARPKTAARPQESSS